MRLIIPRGLAVLALLLKSRVKFSKRKYHRGHHVEGQWVFSGYERGTGRTFVVPVEDRATDTLIIKKWIQPGTIFYSDCWGVYNWC